MIYVETDCTIEHNGHKFESGGAVVTPTRIIGYIHDHFANDTGKANARHPCQGPKIAPNTWTTRYELRDWHGNKLGNAWLISSWRINSHRGSHMHQLEVLVDGVHYTGRGLGHGMLYRGKRKIIQ